MDRKEPSFRERGARGSLGAGVGFSTAGGWDVPDGTTDGGSDARTGAGSSTAGGWDFRDDHHLADSDRSVFCSADSSVLSSAAVGVSRSARSLWVGGWSIGDAPP